MLLLVGWLMAVSESVQVECRECGKHGPVGIALKFTEIKTRSKRGLSEGKTLRCLAPLRTFSKARSEL